MRAVCDAPMRFATKSETRPFIFGVVPKTCVYHARFQAEDRHTGFFQRHGRQLAAVRGQPVADRNQHDRSVSAKVAGLLQDPSGHPWGEVKLLVHADVARGERPQRVVAEVLAISV